MTEYGFLSTFPPTQCGLATFTTALMASLVRPGVDTARVVQAVEELRTVADPVVGNLVAGDEVSARRTAELLGRCDVAVVQHEYGIYGGPDGDEVLGVLQALHVPTILVLHTVLSDPSPHQREVLEAAAAASDAVVTMARTPRQRLARGYEIDMAKVHVIPHGAPPLPAVAARDETSRRPTVLTWGLIGPGKGIEWGIEAMAHLRDLDPQPHYVVVGETHPKVRIHQGEAYRTALAERARELDVEPMVTLDARYLTSEDLAELVAGADLVLLPYESTDQVTSGVLVEAVAAGIPVVATRFPHAVELLETGAGRVVPHRDPAAMAAAIRDVLTRPDLAAAMRREAATIAPTLLWSAVGERYRRLAAAIRTPGAAVRRWDA
ncbi:glycosyltransferase [Georgenia muralis]